MKESFYKGVLYELQAEINKNHGMGDLVVTKHLQESSVLIKLFGAHLKPHESDPAAPEDNSAASSNTPCA